VDDQGIREHPFKGDHIKIAQIAFAYENGKIIEWLRERGEYIGKEKYDKVKEINAEIHHAITTDDKFLDKI
jgi:hypothetical protein